MAAITKNTTSVTAVHQGAATVTDGIFRGTALDLTLFVRDEDGTTVSDLSDFTALTIDVDRTLASTADPLMQKTLASGSFTTLPGDTTTPHATFSFTDTETNVDIGGREKLPASITVHGVTSEGRVTIARGTINILEDNAGTGSPATNPELYYTSSETDAQILLAGGLPTGGTSSQVLAKQSASDFDVDWVDPTAGAGDLVSTNNLSDLADAATARTNLGVDAAGTDNSTDVTLAGTGTYISIAGQVITVDPITESDISDLGAYIENITGEPLSDLSDVTITSIATNEVLQWNGSAWVNRTLAEAGIAASSHNHSGVYQPLDSVLTNTTASFTTADETKLDGIETGATADQTPAEIRAAVESASDSNVFTDADHSKLDGIEAGANVTDAANVSSAGAPIISSGAGAPSSTPSKVGDIYIDTSSDNAYIATGTASSADWEISNDGAGSGSTDLAWTAATSTVESSTGTNATLTAVDGVNPGLMSVADKSKLDGIETAATADQTGAEIKTAYEAEADTNAFTDAEKTKLAGIETAADVTGTANVTAAGALMDSEVTNLAQVKAFDSTDYLAAATKLDDLSAPDDNTDLNATTSAHGLLPKLGGGTTNFLRADGSWAAPPGTGGGGAGAVVETSVWVDAAAMLPDNTTGPEVATITGTNTDVDVLDFNADTDEIAFFKWSPPPQWDGGQISVEFVWSSAETTGDVVWAVSALSISDDEGYDAVSFPAATDVTSSANATTLDLVIDETAAFSVGSTPTVGDLVLFKVSRDADRVGDTKLNDARLFGVRVKYSVTTQLQVLGFACSDETTVLDTAEERVATEVPFDFTVTRVYGSLTVAPTTSFTVDVQDAGTTIFNTANALSFGTTKNAEIDGVFASAAATYPLTKGDDLTIDIGLGDAGGSAAGLKVYIEGYRT